MIHIMTLYVSPLHYFVAATLKTIVFYSGSCYVDAVSNKSVAYIRCNSKFIALQSNPSSWLSTWSNQTQLLTWHQIWGISYILLIRVSSSTTTTSHKYIQLLAIDVGKHCIHLIRNIYCIHNWRHRNVNHIFATVKLSVEFAPLAPNA